MAIITKIEAQKKNDDRVNIYVDEKFFMAIYKELVFSFNLKKGQEIDTNYLKKPPRKVWQNRTDRVTIS